MKIKTGSLATAALAAFVGSTMLAAPAQATGGSEVSLTLTAYDYTKASENIEVRNTTRIVFDDGTEQVTWQDSDHDLRVTRKEIRNAPEFKINATGANASKQIYKKAKKENDGDAAKVVILKKGSKVRNTGEQNGRVGFVYTLPYDTIVVLDKKTKQYRIAYYIIDGKLVKQCGNFIGGNVPMKKKVVQVRYAEDVQLEGDLAVDTEAVASLTFKMQCPNGAEFYVNVNGRATGSASTHFEFTERTRISAVDANSVSVKNEAWGIATGDAYSAAYLKIDVKGKCGDVVTPPPPPPPVEPEPVLTDFRVKNDLEVNAVGQACASVQLAQGRTATLNFSMFFGTVVGPKMVKVTSADNGREICTDIKAPSEVPPGDQGAGIPAGKDRVFYMLVDDSSNKKVEKSADYTVHPTAPHPV